MYVSKENVFSVYSPLAGWLNNEPIEPKLMKC
jgi:hypothetical protein